MKVIPYFSFDGDAEEALNFYKDAFEGDVVMIMRYGDTPSSDDTLEYNDRIMHATLRVEEDFIFFCDVKPGKTVKDGTRIDMMLDCKSEERVHQVFDYLAQNGDVVTPVGQQFWGAIFGAVTDKYGIHWGLNYDLPQE